VSDIAAGYIQDEGMLRAALDAGMNCIDTAEQYPGHHRLVAKAVKGLYRKSVFICLMMHMPEKAELLKTEGFHEAMKELKAEGRVRFVGISNHGSFWFRDHEETMENVLLAAAEDGRFDVSLMPYNFLKMDQAERVLEVCREKKIGTSIMKSTPVAIYYSLKSGIDELEKEKKEVHPLYAEELKRYKDKVDRGEDFIRKYNLQNQEEIQEPAVRFVLENPNVSTERIWFSATMAERTSS
jgi:aryl-alcohol dehydrogenase-like predicted oxidoreductase